MTDAVLLLSPDPAVHGALQAGLRPHGIAVSWSRDPFDVLSRLQSEAAGHALCVIDLDLSSARHPEWSAQGAALMQCFNAMKESGAEVILLSARHRQGDLLELLELEGLACIVAEVAEDDAHELVWAVRRRLMPADELSPLSLLGEVALETRLVRSNGDRDPLLDDLSDHLGQRGASSHAVQAARAVADELIINAVYNAPTDADGSHRYRHRDRRQPVQLSEAEAASFFYGVAAGQVIVGIRDPFGSLDESTVRQYLRRASRGGQSQIEAKQGGAGLGLYVIFSRAHRLFVTITPGESTEFVVVFRDGGSRRAFLTRNKSLHMQTTS